MFKIAVIIVACGQLRIWPSISLLYTNWTEAVFQAGKSALNVGNSNWILNYFFKLYDCFLFRYKEEIMRLRRLLGDQLGERGGGGHHMRHPLGGGGGETAADVFNRVDDMGGPLPPRQSPPLRY